MTKLRMNQTACLALAIAAGLAWAGAVRAGEHSIKIGVMADMTGPLSSASGPGSLEAARMAAEDFGWSVGGKRIEVVSADHLNKPDIGAATARQWFDVEGVDVIADLSNSTVGLAVVEVAKPRNKIVLVSGPGASDFTGKACARTSIHWTWDTYAASTGAVKAMFGPSADTWFFITSDYTFGHALERDASRAVEKLGGKIVGRVRAPLNTPDYSSFLIQAQQSRASVVGFATAGQDTVSLVKQASEFGLTKSGTRLVPLQMMIDEVKAVGLKLGQGYQLLVAFHRTQIQAGTYSAVRHYLQAVKDSGTDEPLAVIAKMRETPVNDIFATGGYIRKDGRMVHDMYLVQIKTPAESTDPWDLVKIVKRIPGDEAFRPLSESECPLVRQVN